MLPATHINAQSNVIPSSKEIVGSASNIFLRACTWFQQKVSNRASHTDRNVFFVQGIYSHIIHTRTHTRTHAHTHAPAHARTHTHTCTCLVYIFKHVSIFVHTHNHARFSFMLTLDHALTCVHVSNWYIYGYVLCMHAQFLALSRFASPAFQACTYHFGRFCKPVDEAHITYGSSK